MFEGNAKRLTLKCLALVLLISGLILFSRDSTRALFSPPQTPTNAAQLPTVTQAEQVDAPLRIVETLVETPGPEKTVVRVVVQNQSAKNIRAFAVTADTHIQFLNLTGRASILLPTQNKVIDITYVGDERPRTVNLAVDFVEFADGTTWGIDTGDSREMLAGQREGAKAERRRLKDLLNSKGRAALTDLLEGNGVLNEPGPSGSAKHSEAWLRGYRNGAGSIRHRVRQALRISDPEHLALELNKSYDTSEDKEQ